MISYLPPVLWLLAQTQGRVPHVTWADIFFRKRHWHISAKIIWTLTFNAYYSKQQNCLLCNYCRWQQICLVWRYNCKEPSTLDVEFILNERWCHGLQRPITIGQLRSLMQVPIIDDETHDVIILWLNLAVDSPEAWRDVTLERFFRKHIHL